MLCLSKDEDVKKKLIEQIMFDLIENLRQKSSKSKKRIAFLSSFTFAGFIFVIWLSIIYPDFRFKESQKQAALASESSPASSFFQNIKEGFSGVKKQFDGVRNIMNSIATTTHYTNESASTTTITPATNSSTTEEFEPNIEVGN